MLRHHRLLLRKNQVLIKEGIRLNQAPVSKEEAIQAAGELLHQLGYVDETYVDAMQEREKLITTYMGMGVAIPHGTSQAKGTVKKKLVSYSYSIRKVLILVMKRHSLCLELPESGMNIWICWQRSVKYWKTMKYWKK